MEPAEVMNNPQPMPRPGRGLFGLRVVLAGLGALLGAVLLTQGFVLIGGILLMMAVLRVVMFVKMRSRRAHMIDRRRAMMARHHEWRGEPR